MGLPTPSQTPGPGSRDVATTLPKLASIPKETPQRSWDRKPYPPLMKYDPRPRLATAVLPETARPTPENQRLRQLRRSSRPRGCVYLSTPSGTRYHRIARDDAEQSGHRHG